MSTKSRSTHEARALEHAARTLTPAPALPTPRFPTLPPSRAAQRVAHAERVQRRITSRVTRPGVDAGANSYGSYMTAQGVWHLRRILVETTCYVCGEVVPELAWRSPEGETACDAVCMALCTGDVR